jgi:hypothetical protein
LRIVWRDDNHIDMTGPVADEHVGSIDFATLGVP